MAMKRSQGRDGRSRGLSAGVAIGGGLIILAGVAALASSNGVNSRISSSSLESAGSSTTAGNHSDDVGATFDDGPLRGDETTSQASVGEVLVIGSDSVADPAAPAAEFDTTTTSKLAHATSEATATDDSANAEESPTMPKPAAVDPTTTAKPATTVEQTTTAKPATTVEQTTTAKPAATTEQATTTSEKPTTTHKPMTAAGEWYEGFDNLDTARWAPEHSTYGDGNRERQCYRPENVSVRDGRLILKAEETTLTCPNGSTRTIASGMVRSRGLTFSPGQAIEFRVRLNVGDSANQAGLWPAVWSSSFAGGGWPKGGELDFLEVMTAEDPNRAMFSMHFANGSGKHQLQNKPSYLDKTFSGDWHTIRFDYGHGGKLVWYLNGKSAFEVDSAPTAQGYPAPFDSTIREIKINLAVGGSPGALASGALANDATFEVDYIRVFNL